MSYARTLRPVVGAYRVPGRALGAYRVPGRAMGLGSLGDAAADAQRYQMDSLSELRNISAIEQERLAKEVKQRWIQIGVTAAIPLFGAIYKILGKALARGE